MSWTDASRREAYDDTYSEVLAELDAAWAADETCRLGHGVPMRILIARLPYDRTTVAEHLHVAREAGEVEQTLAIGAAGPAQCGYRPVSREDR